MEPLPVGVGSAMSFSLLNKRMTMLQGPGKWLRWVKDRSLKNCLLSAVFQRSSGACACLCHHAPNDCFELSSIICSSGVYGIYCNHYHAEDIEDFETSEGIPHFISYNAGTRVLNTYPEARIVYLIFFYCMLILMQPSFVHVQVLVLEDADVADPSTFLRTVLRRPPYLLVVDDHIPALQKARRLGVALLSEAMQLPLANLSLFEEHVL